MLPHPEVLKRSQYFTPPSTEHPHSSRTHYFDWQEYHRPMLRMHHAHLHDWGIASGLAVSVAAGGVEVQPGIAIDGVGELITLALEGQADISPTQPGEAGQQISAPFRLSTAGLTDTRRYLTIQFAERLRFGEGSGGKQEQTPWLRLQPTTGGDAYVDDGTAIILAVVSIDAAGALTLKAAAADLPYGRRILTATTGALAIRRSALADGTVVEQAAGRLEAGSGGGIRLSVTGADDSILLQRADGGTFGKLAINATTTSLQGNLGLGTEVPAAKLHVIGNVLVEGVVNATDFQKNGIPLRLSQWENGATGIQYNGGSVGIGTATPHEKLDVNGRIKAGALSIGPWPVNADYCFLGVNTLDQTQAGNYALLQGVNAETGRTFLNSPVDIHFRIKNADKIVLQNNGNVDLIPPGQLSFGAQTRQMINLWRAEYGIGIQGGTQYFRTASNFAWFRGGTHNDAPLHSGGGAVPMVINGDNVGIGTTTPGFRLDVADRVRFRQGASGSAGIWLHQTGPNNDRAFVGMADDKTVGFWGNTGVGWGLTMDTGNGNVTIRGALGTLGWPATPKTPGWGGGIHTWDVEAEGTMWSRNGYQSGNRDLAENYAATTALEPGDVVCLDLAEDKVTLSSTANDVRVSGIVSTAPGVLLNENHDPAGDKLFPIALCGRVPCKVVAENGPIQRGDLLTSSSTPGHAMKAQPVIIDGHTLYRPGTILGKALASHLSGTGVIEIFVAGS